MCVCVHLERSLTTFICNFQLLAWVHQTLPWLNDRSAENTLDAAQHRLEEFRQYATGTKPPKVEEKGRLEMHFHTLQTKLRLSSRPAYVPSEGKLVNVRRGRRGFILLRCVCTFLGCGVHGVGMCSIFSVFIS